MRLTLATVALLATSAIASAKNGTYISGNIGLGDLRVMNKKVYENNSTSTKMKGFDAGLRLGAAFGYNINDSFAVEFNLQHQSNSVRNTNTRNMTYSTIGFVNGYYFIPGLNKFKPYVGVGLGYGSTAENATNLDCEDILGVSKSINVLAAQGLLGVKYILNENFDIFADVSYAHGILMTSAKNTSDYRPYGFRLGGAFKL